MCLSVQVSVFTEYVAYRLFSLSGAADQLCVFSRRPVEQVALVLWRREHVMSAANAVPNEWQYFNRAWVLEVVQPLVQMPALPFATLSTSSDFAL